MKEIEAKDKIGKVIKDFKKIYSEEITAIIIKLNDIDEKINELQKQRWKVKQDAMSETMKRMEKKYKIKKEPYNRDDQTYDSE